jgi:acetoin utilization deacetylase AcuC-like enzyme
MPASLALYADERMLAHDNGPGHPECPERLRALLEALPGGDGRAEWRRPEAATVEALQRVHTAAHVRSILALRGQCKMIDPDTGVCPDSVDAALLAAGASIDAAAAVVEGDVDAAWALVRPPGHHAEPDRAMGFCLFNNIAVAAAHARAALGCERVLIVDWDVHHGNGTQATFLDRPDVLFFGSHRAPFYPGTGAARETGIGEGAGFTVNVPLPAGVGDDVVVPLYERLLPPIVERFAPDLVLGSAGFDAHVRDPLGGLRVTTQGFAALCKLVRDLAGGRLALVLEGGYDIPALVESAQACVDVLTGGDAPAVDANEGAVEVLAAPVIEAHPHWYP